MKKPLITIGRVEEIDLPEIKISGVSVRVDTGAKTSAIWATGVKEEDGVLSFSLFGKSSPFYTGGKITTKQYELRTVASSNGMAEERYAVKLLIRLNSRQIRATFTLANRSRQVYPILIGRNVLRGKFIVDVRRGKPMVAAERARSQELHALRKRT